MLATYSLVTSHAFDNTLRLSEIVPERRYVFLFQANRIAVVKLISPNTFECLIVNFGIRPKSAIRALLKCKGDPFWVEKVTLAESRCS